MQTSLSLDQISVWRNKEGGGESEERGEEWSVSLSGNIKWWVRLGQLQCQYMPCLPLTPNDIYADSRLLFIDMCLYVTQPSSEAPEAISFAASSTCLSVKAGLWWHFLFVTRLIHALRSVTMYLISWKHPIYIKALLLLLAVPELGLGEIN